MINKTIKILTSAAVMTATALTSAAFADVKVGMITTLSGGGAGLGIDVRDGFMLAIKQSGRTDIEVVIEDDQRKPDIAVQLADKMVQGRCSNRHNMVKPCNGSCAVCYRSRKILSFTECWSVSSSRRWLP